MALGLVAIASGNAHAAPKFCQAEPASTPGKYNIYYTDGTSKFCLGTKVSAKAYKCGSEPAAGPNSKCNTGCLSGVQLTLYTSGKKTLTIPGQTKVTSGKPEVANANGDDPSVADNTANNVDGTEAAKKRGIERAVELKAMQDALNPKAKDPVLSNDGKTKTFYDVDGKVTKIENGSTVNGEFVPKTMTIPNSAATADADFKYSFKSAAGTTYLSDEKDVKDALANAPDGKLTIKDQDGNTKVVKMSADGKSVDILSEKDSSGKNVYTAKSEKKVLTKEELKDKTDPCSVSAGINSKYRCQGTDNWIKGADIGSKVLGTAGKTIVETIGQASAAKAQNGSMSSGFEGSAKMAKTSENYEKALSVMNLAATAVLAKKTANHKRNVGELEAARENAKHTLGGDAEGEISQSKYEAAIKEQRNAQTRANVATFTTAMAGVQSISNAMVARTTRKGAEEAVANAKKLETPANPGIVFDSSGPLMAGVDPNQKATTGLPGNPTTSSQDGATPDDKTGAGSNGLGTGQDLSGGDQSGPAGPAAGAFKAAAGGPGGGSGGGGAGGGAAGGGGGGAGAGAAPDENKAGYASAFETKERYESGSAGGAKGGAGGKGGKDDGAGVDLNGLLAQFMPKTEEDLPNKNGILDFKGGGRAPAAAEEPVSLLDKGADLFQRIHETMSEKNRKGHVGI